MLESKKYSLIEWIISVADEQIIDGLQSVRDTFEYARNKSEKKYSYSTSSYRQILAKSVDVEALKKEQHYSPTSSEELSLIAKEANIQESIEFLLNDLKSIG